MKDEIRRIQALVKNGTLTEEQGGELIAAIAARQPKTGPDEESGEQVFERAFRGGFDKSIRDNFEQVIRSKFAEGKRDKGSVADLAAEIADVVSRSEERR